MYGSQENINKGKKYESENKCGRRKKYRGAKRKKTGPIKKGKKEMRK